MSTKLDFQLKLLVYQKQLELSFFQNVAQTTKRSFSVLYSIGYQVQRHLHLDKSIVPWIESLITTQYVLFCPYVGVFAFLKNKKVWLLFHCKSSIVVLSIYIRTLFYFKIEKNKKERQGNKKIIIWFWIKWLSLDSNSRSLILEASALTTALRKIYNWACICSIWQPIFIINLNTDKTVSMQSELLAFLPTL